MPLPFAAEMMNLYLAEFAENTPVDVHIAMALDGAGWHGEAAFEAPDTITLVPLPPYGPQFHLVERLSLYLG